MKLFLHIGYSGQNYSGWQKQPNAISVQETIEVILERIFKEPVTVIGCGRTDAGVHASQYILHIELSNPVDFDLKFRLNKNLPDDIAVHEIVEVEDNQHARYDATLRTYDYFIHLYKDPFLLDYSSYYEFENLDFDAMKAATDILMKYNDFKAICKHPNFYDNTICEVTNAKLYVDANRQRLRFTITANRFLRGMVRLCVSFLLQIGKRELTLKEFENILANKIDLPNKIPALPNGLYLSKVEYPYVSFKPTNSMCNLLKKGLDDQSN